MDSRAEASSGVCYTKLLSAKEWKPVLRDLKGTFAEMTKGPTRPPGGL